MMHYLINTSGPQPVSYYQENFGGLKDVIHLSGYPQEILREVFAQIQNAAQGEEIHYIHHCMDNSIQGLILPGHATGICSFDVYDPQELSLLGILQSGSLREAKESIAKARQTFQRARFLHEEQEKIYVENMNFSAADALTQSTAEALLAGHCIQAQKGRGIQRFFGAATIDGSVDHIMELTADLPKRYFIKGRPGTGKSTFLRKIAAQAQDCGFDVEVYHCSLDPKSLDMIVIRALGTAYLDSTSPHEYFPTREGDEIIDLYETCITPGTDEKYKIQLDALHRGYKELVGTAVSYLKAAQQARVRLDSSLPPIDREALLEIKGRIVQRLLG